MFFGDKHLFYVLFVRPTSVHVSGNYTFSEDVIGLVPVMLPGSTTFHSLDTSYCTPTDRTKPFYFRALKLYSVFSGASHGDLSSCNFRKYQGHNLPVKTISKTYLDYTKLQVVNQDKSHPTGPHRLLYPSIMSMICNINYQFIHQCFGYDYLQSILQMAKLGIYTGLPNSIPNLSHPCRACIISKGPHLPHNSNVFTENLDPGNCFNLDLSIFNKVYCPKVASPLTIVDATTSKLFGYPTISNCPPLQIIKTFI